MSNKFRALSEAIKGKVLPEQEEQKEQEGEEQATKAFTNVTTIPTKKGRAKGKRSNPDYEQVGVYIPKKTSLEVKRLLLERNDLDFSELVAQLLEKWVKECH